MSQESPSRNVGKGFRFTLGEKITDPAELARRRAQRPLDDGGVDLMIGAALGVVADREARGRPIDLVKGILGLAELLTPEQRREVARQLLERQPAGTPEPNGVSG